MIGCDSIVPPVTLDAADAITSDHGGMEDGNKTGSRTEWKRERRERGERRKREKR